jgi:long-subunit acyl-CoA synthetase (AMP-forming)
VNDAVKTLGEIFENSVREHPDKLAMKKGNVEYSYGQLKYEVLKIKNHLISQGLKKGDRFAVLGENRPEWAVSYLAICRAGLICVPIDPLLSEGEVLHIMRESGARGVFCSENHAYKFEAIKHELKHFRWLIPMNEIKNIEPGREHPDPGIDPKTLAVLIFTSGTTGTSKAVMLNHQNIISNIRAAIDVIRVTPEDRFVSVDRKSVV